MRKIIFISLVVLFSVTSFVSCKKNSDKAEDVPNEKTAVETKSVKESLKGNYAEFIKDFTYKMCEKGLKCSGVVNDKMKKHCEMQADQSVAEIEKGQCEKFDKSKAEEVLSCLEKSDCNNIQGCMMMMIHVCGLGNE